MLRVGAKTQSEHKANGVHHHIGQFVVPGFLRKFKREVEFQNLPPDREREENVPVAQQVATKERPLNKCPSDQRLSNTIAFTLS